MGTTATPDDGRPCAPRYGWEQLPDPPVARRPNPAHPRGSEVDVSVMAPEACRVELPYPAFGRGTHTLRCDACGASVRVFAHGQADDPVAVTFACRWRAPTATAFEGGP